MLLIALALALQAETSPADADRVTDALATSDLVSRAEINHQQRRRVMTLIREGDCEGAHGAVYVMGDAEMFDLVESQCPVAISHLQRWDDAYRTDEPWNDLPFVTPAPES